MTTVAEKAEALRRALEGSPWFLDINVGECGGKPAIFVYVSRDVPLFAVPEVWRGVPVLTQCVNSQPARGK